MLTLHIFASGSFICKVNGANEQSFINELFPNHLHPTLLDIDLATRKTYPKGKNIPHVLKGGILLQSLIQVGDEMGVGHTQQLLILDRGSQEKLHFFPRFRYQIVSNAGISDAFVLGGEIAVELCLLRRSRHAGTNDDRRLHLIRIESSEDNGDHASERLTTNVNPLQSYIKCQKKGSTVLSFSVGENYACGHKNKAHRATDASS